MPKANKDIYNNVGFNIKSVIHFLSDFDDRDKKFSICLHRTGGSTETFRILCCRKSKKGEPVLDVYDSWDTFQENCKNIIDNLDDSAIESLLSSGIICGGEQ